MTTALAATLLAIQLAGSPHAPPPPARVAWDDDAGDLARIGRLAVRFDLAVLRRDAALLAAVEGRVRDEIAAELEEARRERRAGIDRRVGALERAGRLFAELGGRTDRRSLDRKRAALADVSQAAWAELVDVAGGHERWREARADRYDERQEERWDDRGAERRRDEREGWRPPPPVAVIHPMAPDRFEALLRAMQREPFASAKLRVLDSALGASDEWLSVAQAGRLLGQLTFAQEKLELLRRVRPRLLDAQDGYQLLEAFSFDADKEEARRILGP